MSNAEETKTAEARKTTKAAQKDKRAVGRQTPRFNCITVGPLKNKAGVTMAELRERLQWLEQDAKLHWWQALETFEPKDGDLMTPEEAAEFLKVHKASVYLQIKMGKLPFLQMGRRYRVSRGAILRMLKQQPERPKSNGEWGL